MFNSETEIAGDVLSNRRIHWNNDDLSRAGMREERHEPITPRPEPIAYAYNGGSRTLGCECTWLYRGPYSPDRLHRPGSVMKAM